MATNGEACGEIQFGVHNTPYGEKAANTHVSLESVQLIMYQSLKRRLSGSQISQHN